MEPMPKFQIFFGNQAGISAATKINNWLKKNKEKGIHIVSWEYQQARMGDHSICIMYVEDTE